MARPDELIAWIPAVEVELDVEWTPFKALQREARSVWANSSTRNTIKWAHEITSTSAWDRILRRLQVMKS